MVEWYNKICDELDLDSVILKRSVIIFLIFIGVIALMVICPILFIIIAILLLSILIIGLIYAALE